MAKTGKGHFFEDYTLGEVIDHAVPRTVSGGERAMYHSLYPARHAIHSSDEFAHCCGLRASPINDWAVFHIAFGKTVPDISLNAVANLGYAQGRWLQPVFAGDTLRSQSKIIGLRQNSSGKTGVVWVRSQGINQRDEPVVDYVRWVIVHKRDFTAPTPRTFVPEIASIIPSQNLVIPEGLDFSGYNFVQSGEPHRWNDYEIGEKIDHVDGVTVEEAEHMIATRLWQNTARVHFDSTARKDGKRLIYGGHVISVAHALSFNGLANAQLVVALNAGTHANPCFAGDTIHAWSEVLGKAMTAAPGIGAIRLRLVATSKWEPFVLRSDDGKYLPHILLDIDYWALMPL